MPIDVFSAVTISGAVMEYKRRWSRSPRSSSMLSHTHTNEACANSASTGCISPPLAVTESLNLDRRNLATNGGRQERSANAMEKIIRSRASVGWLVGLVAVSTLTLFPSVATAESSDDASGSSAVAGTGDHETSGLIDLATFEGPLTVEVDGQLVEINVKYGQAEQTVEALRSGEEPTALSARSGSEAAPMAICVEEWKNAVAGPGTWWTSANGCSIWGSPGFQKGYEFLIPRA